MDVEEITEYAYNIYNARFYEFIDNFDWDGVEVNQHGRLQYWSNGIPLSDISEQEQQELDKLLQHDSIELLGVGTSRISVRDATSNTVYKISRYGTTRRLGDGVESARLELELYESSDVDCLLPILNIDDRYHWVEMPYARLLDTETEEKQEEVINKITQSIEEAGISSRDISAENIGYWKGKWYLLDYGVEDFRKDDTFGVFPAFGDVIQRYTEK